ncbi:MAG: DUF805 domain-containing protein [Dehalococcoidia bacterium]
MKIVDAVVACFRKYATFSGRSTRLEYWSFFLFSQAVVFLIERAAWFAYVVGVPGATTAMTPLFMPQSSVFAYLGILTAPAALLVGLLSLLMLVPGYAVAVRRLHDSGRSAWWLIALSAGLLPVVVLPVASALAVAGFVAGAPVVDLLMVAQWSMWALPFAPYVGFAIRLYLLTRPSEPRENRYGPQPGLAPSEA